MRALLLLVSTVLYSSFIFSQTTTTFRINYDQALLDLPGNATESLTNNQYVFAGTNLSFLPYGTVTELDANGDLVWSKRYSDGSFGFQLNDIKKDQANSEYYLCGGSESNAGVFMRIDATGAILVSTKFEINEADGAFLNRVIKTSDGGYVAVGYVTGHAPGGGETYFGPISYTDDNGDPQTETIGSPLMVKFDANGDHLWHHVTRYYTTATRNPGERIYNDASFKDVVETADGYMAVGQYDVNQHLSNTNGDGDDATPTDALIFKTDASGNVAYHRQVDNPNTSPTQDSKYLSAINKTSVGDPIAAGGDNSRELIMKYGATGAFSLTFSRRFTYSTVLFGSIVDPVDVSQIYEVNGGTDLVTMGMYIRPLSFEFSNSLHRMNASASSTTWAKKYTFGLASLLPRGQQTSDGGFIMASTTTGISYDYQIIKTDPSGDTPLTGCPPGTFSPSASSGPTTIATPHHRVFSGTPGPNSLTVAVANITPAQDVVCRIIECTPPPLATTVTATPATICAGQSSSISASGSATGVSYNVYDAATGGTNLGEAPLSVSPGTTTTYYVETVDDSDPTCVSSSRVAVTVTVNPSPTVTIPAGDDEICIGESVNITPNSGGTWVSSDPTIATITNAGVVNGISAGTAEMTFTDGTTGCESTSTLGEITVNAFPTINIPAGDDEICIGESVNITPNSGGTWASSDPTVATITNAGAVNGISAGTAEMTFTDGTTGCESTSTLGEITVKALPTINIPAGDDEICIGESVNITPNSGGTWASSDPTVATITNAGAVNGISAGTAEMTFTDGTTGCESTSTLGEITVNALPTINIPAGDDEICIGESVNITPNSGGTWASSDPTVATITNAGVINGISAGTTEMTFTDGTTGCESTGALAEITVNALPTINIPAGDDEICIGESVNITPNSGGTWASSDPTVATITNAGAVNGISAGTAEMTFTDGTTGCESTSTLGEITVNALPTINIPAGDDEICIGESVNITPNSGGTWASSDPTVATITNAGAVNGISAGTTEMTFTDGTTGCESTSTLAEITVNALPTINIPAGDDEICVGETVNITPNSGGTWASSDPTVATITNTGAVDGISAGTAEMTFTDGTTGCESTSTLGEITVIALPTINIPAGDEEICIGETVNITPNSGGTWVSSDPSVATITNAGAVNGISAGTADISFTNAITGCSNTSGSVTITVNALPTLTIAGTDISCNGNSDGEATVTPVGNGPFNYNWSPSGGSGATATGLGSGAYTVTVTDDNGCESNETVTINEPTEITFTTSSTESQCTIDDGSATVVASGGTGTYTYLWTPSGQTTATANGIGAGSYSVEVKDINNCSVNTTVLVESLNGPTVTIIDQQNVSCVGANDGFAEVEATGGTPGYTYNWSPSGGNQATSTGLSAGTYTIQVTDNAGCTAIETVGITTPDALTISETITAASCGQTNGTIVTNVAGGTPSYTYDWTPNVGNTSTIGSLGGGSYALTITDANGCQISQTYVVGVNGALPINITPPSATIDAGESVDLSVETASGVSGETYSWTPSEGLSCTDCPDPNAAPSETTTYYVEVTTPDGCSAMDSIVIVVDQPCGELFVPTIFSPNNDGNNDLLCIYGGCINDLEFQIYNRWGELIFTTNDNTECWDGTQNGEPVNTGVYVYKLNATIDNEVVKESGNINVVR